MASVIPRGDDVVCGVGARTHAGLDALQVALATRAGKMRPRPSHVTDRFGERVATCRLWSIPDNVQGIDRFAALAAPALVQATEPWRSLLAATGHDAEPLPVVLAVPEADRPGFDPRIARDLLPLLQARSQIVLDAKRSKLVSRGRGGGVEAFRAGLELLSDGAHRVAVGGVDSLFDADLLEWLDREMRLHSLEAENGFIPGEGAAFLLLARRGRTLGLPRLASLVDARVEDEPRPYGSTEPTHALAMTHAVKLATGVHRTARRIPWMLTDVANERHRVDEWQMVMGRMFRAFTMDARHDQPLLKTGEVGAASAALLAAIACAQWNVGCAPGASALIACHSDGAERGAMLLVSEEASR